VLALVGCFSFKAGTVLAAVTKAEKVGVRVKGVRGGGGGVRGVRGVGVNAWTVRPLGFNREGFCVGDGGVFLEGGGVCAGSSKGGTVGSVSVGVGRRGKL